MIDEHTRVSLLHVVERSITVEKYHYAVQDRHFRLSETPHQWHLMKNRGLRDRTPSFLRIRCESVV